MFFQRTIFYPFSILQPNNPTLDSSCWLCWCCFCWSVLLFVGCSNSCWLVVVASNLLFFQFKVKQYYFLPIYILQHIFSFCILSNNPNWYSCFCTLRLLDRTCFGVANYVVCICWNDDKQWYHCSRFRRCCCCIIFLLMLPEKRK